MRRSLTLFALVSALAGASAVAPSLASASSAWVSSAPPSSPFNSCAHPGYNSVQAAVDASVATVHLCDATYVEQVQVQHAVAIVGEGATLKLPASPVNGTTPCDTAPGMSNFQPNQTLLTVCTSGTVKVTTVTFEAAWPAGTCYGSMYGIFVGGGGTFLLSESTVAAAGAVPLNGCQGGVGIELGSARAEPTNETTKATLTNDLVQGYQKNGITEEGAGTTATIKGATVIGAGATPEIAQNGIQISYGSQGKVKNSTVINNECNAPSCGANALTDYQSTGLLFFGAAVGSVVTGSHVNGNDIGVYNADTQATEPGTSQLLVSGDVLNGNRYEGVLLDQGWATVKSTSIGNGNVGIMLLQYAEQVYGPKGTAAKDTISGMSVWGVQGLSDEAPADKFGSISIASSALSGNPGPTVAESVSTNNPAKLKILTNGTDT